MIGLLSSCQDAPKPPSKIKLYKGESLLGGFIGDKENCPGDIINHDGEEVCFLDPDDDAIDDMVATNVDDYEAVQLYILELVDKCEKWK